VDLTCRERRPDAREAQHDVARLVENVLAAPLGVVPDCLAVVGDRRHGQCLCTRRAEENLSRVVDDCQQSGDVLARLDAPRAKLPGLEALPENFVVVELERRGVDPRLQRRPYEDVEVE
jgi:hypothetical protein